ncbi:MAG: response regulator [Armatimonadia bacterium]
MQAEGASRTVLVVDDDAFIARAVGCILEQARQARVLAAGNGEEALPLAEISQPDVIIIDVNMPGMEALELCRRLRAVPELAETPLYVLTGVLPGNEVLGPLREYVQGILNKPPNPGELLAALDAVG